MNVNQLWVRILCSSQMGWNALNLFRFLIEHSQQLLLQNNKYVSRALARKLKLTTLSRNWEIRLAFTKGHNHSWRQEFFFATTRRTLENAILGKKYFRARLYAIHTNHHEEMFFSFFIINLMEISNRSKQADWFWLDKSSK